MSFLTEEYVEGAYNNVKRAPPGLLYEVRSVVICY
jgi:hypothetical protein